MAQRRSDLRADRDDRPAPRRAPDRNRRKPARRKTTGSWRRRLALWTLRWAAIATVWGIVALGGVLGYFWFTLPETGDLAAANRQPSVTLLASDGSLIATYGDLVGQPLPLKDMSPWLPKAVIATEDRRFYSHFGIDPIGILRAAWVNYRAGHIVQGGSTITQQLAKNLFLTPERTTRRKIQEALLALWLERRFTKDQILGIYLNRVYLGAGTYGVDAAAHRYFDKSARDLTLFESAIIAGLLKAPTRFSPTHDRDLAAQRADQVLANMVDAGFVTQAQADAAERQGARILRAVVSRPGSRYFADWAMEQVDDFGGGARQDLTVVTTLDPRMQAAAETAVTAELERDGGKARASQAALVALSPDGAVRAMVGGRDWTESQFNRVTQAQRQPGSAFKPIIYLAGLEAGLTPQTRMVDRPIRIGDWEPHNYTNRYAGEMTLAEALARSINTIAVQVSERAGHERIVEVARQLGIQSELPPDASIALGTGEVTLLELTGAYAAFASGGYGAIPYGIKEIRTNSGKVLYHRSGGGPGRVIPAGLAGEMNEMLAGVMTQGTGRGAAIGRPAGGKTGTTSDYRDALFVGYTPDLVAGVWFGNDDNSPMNKVTGSSLPARTWRSFMLAALKDVPPSPLFTAPAPEMAQQPGAPSWIERLFGLTASATPRTGAPRTSVTPAAARTRAHWSRETLYDGGGQ